MRSRAIAGHRDALFVHPLLGRRLLWLFQLVPVILCAVCLPSPLAAKTPPSPASALGYLSALATADRYLQAWQSGDVETGMTLLTSRAKEKVTADMLEETFSASGPRAYEIGRGKLVHRGRYEFPVVEVVPTVESKRARRRFSNIVIVNTGHNDWAVDKLP